LNKDEFIAAIRVAVHDSAIKGMKTNLASPPGRRPYEKTKETSRWFNSLPDEDKRQVEEIIKQAVHSSVFGFLCVLDGVSAIESTSEKGSLELSYNKNGNKTLINDERGEMLHDIYQSAVYSEIYEGLGSTRPLDTDGV
jgi:hypothetical protein